MPDENSSLINLSFSMHSGPGTFALLLGSGISQGARIPTGWDIVLDLIRKLAILEGEPTIDNPEQWFKDKYHEEPKYSSLVDRVAPSQTDRRNLLKKYIEPTEEEREQGLKVPSQSHKVIAQLVKSGIVRLIVTTNIDQLLETSLKEIGITPVVIFNDDSLEGAIPYVHSECTIIKLHGDYLDTRIKNTPDELAQYSEKMNSCLDRIFDEFGLVICGWSAKWDIALRDALCRRHNWRFSTYWMYPRGLSSEASGLNDHLRGIPLQIENADKFFLKLSENIDALRTFELPHPLSVPLAIAQVKKYVAEQKYRIQLHDLIEEITIKSVNDCQSEHFKTTGISLTPENYTEIIQNRMHRYENLMQIPVATTSTLVFFDDGKNSKEITKVLERILQYPGYNGLTILVKLQYYPSLLLSYAIGITALESMNYNALSAILLKPSVYDLNDRKPAVYFLNPWKVMSSDLKRAIDLPDAGNRFTPLSDYLCKLLSGSIGSFFTNSRIYEEKFDIYEYLLALTYLDKTFDDLTWEERNEAPIGRFYWRIKAIPEHDDNHISQFFKRGLRQGENWDLLKAGFFGGSPNRLKQCINALEGYLGRQKHTHIILIES